MTTGGASGIAAQWWNPLLTRYMYITWSTESEGGNMSSVPVRVWMCIQYYLHLTDCQHDLVVIGNMCFFHFVDACAQPCRIDAVSDVFWSSVQWKSEHERWSVLTFEEAIVIIRSGDNSAGAMQCSRSQSTGTRANSQAFESNRSFTCIANGAAV